MNSTIKQRYSKGEFHGKRVRSREKREKNRGYQLSNWRTFCETGFLGCTVMFYDDYEPNVLPANDIPVTKW